MTSYEYGPSSNSFDAEYLKTLPREQLVEALLADAQATVLRLPDAEQETAITMLFGICAIYSDEQKADIERAANERDQTLGELSSIFLDVTQGQNLSSEESLAYMVRRNRDESQAEIKQTKQEIQQGLKMGMDNEGKPWSEYKTKDRLQLICGNQLMPGVPKETAFVRHTALANLNHHGYKGVIFLHNALSGDLKSYQLGIEAFQAGLREGNLGGDELDDGIGLVRELIENPQPLDKTALNGLSIDMLVKLRTRAQTDWEAREYAFVAAQLAVTYRDS